MEVEDSSPKTYPGPGSVLSGITVRAPFLARKIPS
jgi:hypothetical protein